MRIINLEYLGIVWDIEFSSTMEILQEFLELVANKEFSRYGTAEQNTRCGSLENAVHVRGTEIEDRVDHLCGEEHGPSGGRDQHSQNVKKRLARR